MAPKKQKKRYVKKLVQKVAQSAAAAGTEGAAAEEEEWEEIFVSEDEAEAEEQAVEVKDPKEDETAPRSKMTRRTSTFPNPDKNQRDLLAVKNWRLAAFMPVPGAIPTEEISKNRGLQTQARCGRVCWFLVLFLLTLGIQMEDFADNDLTSALRGETVDEFFPDAGKASERLKESEVTAGLKEELHSDDVAQTLSWYTTFCRVKNGADDHIMDSWDCKLNSVKIGDAKPSYWNVAENRALSDEDFYFSEYSIGASLEERMKKAQDMKEEKEKPAMETIAKVCDKRFLFWHMGIGDDTHGLMDDNHAEFGDADAFNKHVIKPLGVGPISGDYDEFTVLENNQMFSDLGAQVDSQLKLSEKLDAIEAHADGSNARVHKAAEELKQENTANDLKKDQASLFQSNLSAYELGKETASDQSGDQEDAFTHELQTLKTFVENLAEQQKHRHHGQPARKQRSKRARGGRLHRSADAYRSALAEVQSLSTNPKGESSSTGELPQEQGQSATTQDQSSKDEESLPNGATTDAKEDESSKKNATPPNETQPNSKEGESNTEKSESPANGAKSVEKEPEANTNKNGSTPGQKGPSRGLQLLRAKIKEVKNMQTGVDALRDEHIKYDAYETGCFDPKDQAGQMMDLWRSYDHDMDLVLKSSEIQKMLQWSFPSSDKNLEEELKRIDRDGNMEITVAEFFDFLAGNYENITFPPPGRLKPSCRNHHWGLMSACKPEWIEASYQIQNVRRTPERNYPGPYIVVNLRFDALGSQQRAGWYKASLNIYTERSYDEERSIWYFICMNFQLLLVFLVLGIEFLCTWLLFPSNLYAFLSLEFAEGTKFAQAKPVIMKHLLAIVDGRAKRSSFMGFGMIIFEHFIMGMIIMNWCEATREAFEPAPLPIGLRSPECKKALFETRASSAPAFLAGNVTQTGLSEYEKLQLCYNFTSTREYVAAMEEELLFSSSAGVVKIILLLFMMRLLEVLDFSRFFRWLPDTMRMAFWKLFNFLVVYFIVVFGLAVIFTAKFGAMYQQFRSIGQSVIALLFFSFGDTERAMDGLHPFIEDSGTLGAVWLLFFTICITTIGLGFFTTIILDAYTIASDGSSEVDNNGMLDDAIALVAPYFGIEDDEEGEKDVGKADGQGKEDGQGKGEDENETY